MALGTLDQEDMSGVNAAREVFAWHRDHQDVYTGGSESAARVLLLPGREPAYRGFFRLLSELHVPFAVGETLEPSEKLIEKYDLIVAPDGAPKGFEPFVRQGGSLLAAGVEPPAFLGLKGVQRWERTRSAYLRVHDLDLLPSLRASRVMLLDGPYLELAPTAKPLLRSSRRPCSAPGAGWRRCRRNGEARTGPHRTWEGAGRVPAPGCRQPLLPLEPARSPGAGFRPD